MSFDFHRSIIRGSESSAVSGAAAVEFGGTRFIMILIDYFALSFLWNPNLYYRLILNIINVFFFLFYDLGDRVFV